MGFRKITSAEIVERLNQEINAVLGADTGVSAFLRCSAELGAFVANEIEKWATVVKFAGID
jgi:hypothetical protein